MQNLNLHVINHRAKQQKAKPVASCDKPHSLSLSLHRRQSLKLHVSSENAQESFISHFLSRGHIKHRFRKENASERQENALKRKPIEGQLRAIEGIEGIEAIAGQAYTSTGSFM